MNNIEQMFYDAFMQAGEEEGSIVAQVPIGIYVADFVIYPTEHIPIVVEIDGHEFHKTKEQRFADYRKERFFMNEGYVVVRFMGSEVFVNPNKCVEETTDICCLINEKVINAYELGTKSARR